MAKSAVVEAPKQSGIHVTIPAPNIKTVTFHVVGTAPMVVHRFSHKVKTQMIQKMEAGSTARKGQKREAANLEEMYNEARYISKDGWDGFNASAVRNSMISACRLVGFKMTLAKLSLFVIQDGWDAKEPEIPLVRIIGKPRRLESRANVETGQAYITIRPCYDKWEADVKIRYDADQFTVADIANLLSRVGTQVGWCEGRPDSKNSAGMGWGTFVVQGKEE
jgi:hypothetical protein